MGKGVRSTGKSVRGIKITVPTTNNNTKAFAFFFVWVV